MDMLKKSWREVGGEGAAPPHMAQLGSNIAPRSIQPQRGVMIAAGKGNEVLTLPAGRSATKHSTYLLLLCLFSSRNHTQPSLLYRAPGGCERMYAGGARTPSRLLKQSLTTNVYINILTPVPGCLNQKN